MTNDEFGELRLRVLGALHDFGDREPEDGETWESWFHAAFDLARAKIDGLLTDAMRKAAVSVTKGETP